jgi:hypothetical protein
MLPKSLIICSNILVDMTANLTHMSWWRLGADATSLGVNEFLNLSAMISFHDGMFIISTMDGSFYLIQS